VLRKLKKKLSSPHNLSVSLARDAAVIVVDENARPIAMVAQTMRGVVTIAPRVVAMTITAMLKKTITKKVTRRVAKRVAALHVVVDQQPTKPPARMVTRRYLQTMPLKAPKRKLRSVAGLVVPNAAQETIKVQPMQTSAIKAAVSAPAKESVVRELKRKPQPASLMRARQRQKAPAQHQRQAAYKQNWKSAASPQ
jgi:hypothetical protein